MAVPTSTACSELRCGSGFQTACCFLPTSEASGVTGLGRGTPKSLETFSPSSSAWTMACCFGATAAFSDGLGAMAAEANVLTARAKRYAQITVATNEPTQE